MSLRRLLSVSATVTVLLGSAMPNGATAAEATAADSPAASTIVMARDFMFAPAALTVGVGATVTWTNKDDEPHTVVSDAGLFRSGALDTGESFSFKFDRPGTYRYACSIHPRMVGTIVVQ
jgi:plastocyanin